MPHRIIGLKWFRLLFVLAVCSACSETPSNNPEQAIQTPRWERSLVTNKGLYRVIMRPVLEEVSLRSFETWRVQILTADGDPVVSAAIEFDGGMPLHGHGLPSSPRVKNTSVPGVFLIEGLQLNMSGKWAFDVKVKQPAYDF